jgi:cytoskeletal protein CcmA (bactofilin family)
VYFATVDESRRPGVKQLALFNKSGDHDVRKEATPRFTAQPQVEPKPVAQITDPANSAPEEKPANSVRGASIETGGRAGGRAYLDTGSKIMGKVWFDGATRIDGQVDGEITAKETLVIGESAVVTAQIKANSIIVAGRASGDIVASHRLEIRPSARVSGNLTSPVVIVHEGAIFEGHCSMREGIARDSEGAEFRKEARQSQIAQK